MSKESNKTQGLTAKKSENFSEWYTQVIEKAEITDIRLGIKGFITIRPWGTLMIEKLYDMFEKELQDKGHLPVIMPSVIPESNLKKEASHIQGFTPEVFWLKTVENEEKLALRPTSETIFTPMFALWVRSHRDLPLKLYQRGSVFRYDTKATRPLIRGREFQWIECHDAFATKKEAEAQVKEDIDTTKKILYEQLGIPFLAMKRPSWDKFAGADFTIGSDVLMPDGRVIQQPSTHMMGQKFSKAFNATFKDENGKDEFLWTTAYGPAISRILASLISMHGDNSGLVLPFCIAPLQVIIVPIFNLDNKEKIMKYAEGINDKLKDLGIKSELDSRDKRPGEKFYEWELKGVPLRIEVGEKEFKKKKITLFTRDTSKKEYLNSSSLSRLKSLGQDFDQRLMKRADGFMKGKIAEGKTKDEIKKALNSGKIVRADFCSVESSGLQCAEHIEKDFNASVRGVLANKSEKPKGKCIICNKKATSVVYIAKSY